MDIELTYYGDPVLREKAKPVVTFDSALRELADQMLKIMHEANGVGLAAEQVGRTEAMCLIDVPPAGDLDEDGNRLHPDIEMPLVLVNPKIMDAAEEKVSGEEGCLSFPGIYARVTRPASVKVGFQDLDGQAHELEVRGLLARAIQHELDHLDGVLICDRMSSVKKAAISGKLKRLRKETQQTRGII